MGIGEIIGGGIGLLGSIFGAEEQAGAIETAGGQQLAATQQQIAFQREVLKQTRADLAEAVDKGLIDLDTAYNAAVSELQPYAGRQAYNLALGYLEQPQNIMQLPGVQFQYEQGQRALENLLSKTTGGGLSSDAVRAAQEYGQNFAATQIDTALNRLIPFINLSYGAGTNLANLATGLGTAQSNLRMAGAGGQAQAAGQMSPAIAQGMGQIGQIGATTSLGLGQTYSDLIGNIAGVLGQAAGSQTVQNWAKKLFSS